MPSQHIALLTTTQSQADLLEEIVQKKTAWHKALGRPGVVARVEDFHSQKSDVVILSLVRTSSAGELQREERLVTALSRARKSLLILGNLRTYQPDKAFSRVLAAMQDKSHKLLLSPPAPSSVSTLDELSKANQQLFVSAHPSA